MQLKFRLVGKTVPIGETAHGVEPVIHLPAAEAAGHHALLLPLPATSSRTEFKGKVFTEYLQ
jgi:hypothetical protein